METVDLFKRYRSQIIALLFIFSASFSWAGWSASVGKVEITPDLSQTVYLAGFGAKGRIPTGIHDPFWARGFAISDGRETVVLITVDLIGFPRPYVEKIRASVKEHAYILVSANHTHSGPDTLGLWGAKAGVSGVDPAYMQSLVEKISALTRDLIKNLQSVEISAASIPVPVEGIIKDIREPIVIDNELSLLRFKNLKTGKTMGTLLNWACHPEVLGEDNTLATRDFSGYFVDETEKLLGGMAGHFAGAIGGLMTPDAKDESFEEAERIGKTLAKYAAQAAKQAQVIKPVPLSVHSAILRIPIENTLYLAFLSNVKHGRTLYDQEGKDWKAPYWENWPVLARLVLSWIDTKISPNYPQMETETSVIHIGEAGFIAIPGELLPELAIGGYQGEYAFHYPVVSPANPNPPDLTRAPKGPYLKERLQTRYRFLLGLANDELGYIVPAYDFKINRWSPILSPRPKGTHYEETNSVGPQAETRILGALEPLFR